jgi:hypothetical protein
MMDPRSNVPVLVWAEGTRYVAECLLIPSCRIRASTREQALRAISRLIAERMEARAREGWSLPAGYEVIHMPAAGI